MEFNANISQDGIRVLFHNGIGLHVHAHGPMLRFLLTIPQQYRGNTAGLLGRFNGDATDDLWLSDGSTLPSDSSMDTIHDEFGPSCEYRCQIGTSPVRVHKYTSYLYLRTF